MQRGQAGEPDRGIGRREFLLGAAGTLAAGATAGLLGQTASAAPSAALRALGRTRLRAPGSLPFPALPAGTDTMPQIEHVVLLMLENHSYDNLFGMLGRGDGFKLDAKGQPTATNPYPDGCLQHAFHMPTTCQLAGTPSQEWQTSHEAYDNGKNDGFVRSTVGPTSSEIVGPVAMGYWTGEDLPFTYSLASKFPIGDRWFCCLLGQTDPNRRYLIAATSAGMTDDIGEGAFNAISDTTLPLPAGGTTIFNQLDLHGISWTNYVSQYPTGATPFLYPTNDAATEALKHKALSDFFTDAAADALPSFSFLDPNYSTQSQENPQNIVVGEGLLAHVVHALGESRAWKRSMLIVCYDEHGGYYDHVPPPPAIAPDAIPPVVYPGESTYDGFTRYGFRIPSVIVSPYAKQDHVSHVLYDHTSILATLERKWNLPALTYRDANANDLSDFLDLKALHRRRPTFPRLPRLAPPGNTPSRLACSTSGPGQIPPSGSISC